MNRRRILFVDDNRQFLESIREIMVGLSDGTWEVLLAESAGAALALLQQEPVDLVVVDLEMPVLDGVQFLRLLQRKYPNIPRTALTSHATEERRAACLSAGAEFCLQKPLTPGEARHLYATLNALAHPLAEEGFRGVLRRVGLTDVLQMECLAANSSVLEVTAGNVTGEIYIRSGNIIHARAGALKGVEAFNRLLTLRGGQFALRPFVAPPEQTIHGSWEMLLMEAARQQDEARAAVTAEAPPVPPPPKARPAVVEAPSMTSYLPRHPETAAPVTTGRTRIDEVLLCSAQGDVLYEWGCANTDARISLLEFLSQKAWQISLNLPTGAFDRIEIQGPQTRVVAQVQSDRGLFVRSSQPAEGAS